MKNLCGVFTSRFTSKSHSPRFKSLHFGSNGVAMLATSVSLSIIMLSSAAAETNALPQGEHVAAEVDISQPIASINNLESLKRVEPLSMNMLDFKHFKTNNGVPVIFYATDQLPIVDVDIRFNAGSARDKTIRKDSLGLSSMVASMLTKGTKDLDETAFAEASEQLGIELNAASYKDQFNISLRSLSNPENLYPALALMQDIMVEPRFDPQVLERNKAQRVLGLKQMEQNPNYVAQTTFSQALYGDHPYAHSSYGTIDSVPTLSTDDLTAFKQRYLVAQNASLSITGDLDLKAAKSIANQLTDALPIGQPAPALPQPKPIDESKWIQVDFNSDQTTVLIGQLGYALAGSPQALQKQTQFKIGNEVLAGGGFNSRLMQKIRKQMGYTYGIYGSMSPMQVNGPYTIGFSSRNEKVGDAIDATLETVRNTLNGGVSTEEFQLTKENLINSYPMGFASNASINGILGFLNFNNLPDTYVSEYIDRIENASLESVNQTLRDSIEPDNFIIVTVGQPELDESVEFDSLIDTK